jgi:hypothetical protein
MKAESEVRFGGIIKEDRIKSRGPGRLALESIAQVRSAKVTSIEETSNKSLEQSPKVVL